MLRSVIAFLLVASATAFVPSASSNWVSLQVETQRAETIMMGRGDKRTTKGKRFLGSTGKKRTSKPYPKGGRPADDKSE
eukprot:CAMPEP_0182600572 /NCGR_PEP_ID=MMETSP1324-20130603/91050_1 /TAXON_ID=236786 /ORGANISM="Florenciella sp., Strain RCC1587" /LENGTH=78 /DNA_ID=CAMNT_0024818479 /DNA_START=26 /DNA_END=262 /DNA_ORIENTATION=-